MGWDKAKMPAMVAGALLCLLPAFLAAGAHRSSMRVATVDAGSSAGGAAPGGTTAAVTGTVGGAGGATTGAGTITGSSAAAGRSGAGNGIIGRQGATAAGPVAPGAVPGGPATPQLPLTKTVTSSCKGAQVGFSYPTDVAAAGTAVGVFNPQQAASAPSGDTYKASIQAAVDYTNQHGGLGGCPIQPVYFPFHIANGDFVTEAQQECALDTQDNHVVAAIPMAWEDQTMIACLAQAHVPVIWGVNINTQVDEDSAGKYPGILYMPWAVAGERMTPFIDYLRQAGYFDPGTKLGVVIPADSAFGASSRLWNNQWKPRLAALGIDVAATFTYPQRETSESQGASDIAQYSSSAVLQFKGAGVNHVLFVPGGSSAFGFIPAAKSQDFHPRYAMTSNDYPGLAATVGGSELTGAVGIGWIQSLDAVPNNQIVDNPARALCDNIIKGQAPLANGGTYYLCDGLSFLQEAWNGTTQLTAATLGTGASRIGGSFMSATTFGPATIGNGRIDGDQQVRVLAYDTSASSWTYAGPLLTVPNP